MNMELIYEYGSRAGFWRLHRLFTERDAPVTVYAVATAMARNPQAVAAMNEAGWEIATHGYKWIDYRDAPADIEARDIAEAIKIHTMVAGARPLGFYQGRSSINTIRLGAEEGGFLYCADAYADDLPYWIEGPKGPQLIVPYTLDSNDMRFATAQGFNSGDQFFSYLKDSFDTLYAEGAVAPKMLSIGLHCRLVGRPGRAASLARFLDYVAAFDKVWIATRLDIARHWIANHPPAGGWKPSRISRALFAERFGGVYEHSRWVAEAAYDVGLERGRGQRRWPRAGDGAGDGAGKRSGQARADRRPSRSRRQARARQDAHRRVDARAGERRARPAERRRTRALHRAQRGLSRALRLPLHHGGEGQDRRTIFSPPSSAGSITTAQANSPRRSPRSIRSRRCG